MERVLFFEFLIHMKQIIVTSWQGFLPHPFDAGMVGEGECGEGEWVVGVGVGDARFPRIFLGLVEEGGIHPHLSAK